MKDRGSSYQSVYEEAYSKSHLKVSMTERNDQ